MITKFYIQAQHVEQKLEAKNFNPMISIDMSLKMIKINIQMCDTHCHTLSPCVPNREGNFKKCKIKSHKSCIML